LFRWPARPTLLTSIAVRMVSDSIMSGMAAIAAGSPSAPASASLSRSRIAVTATTSSVQTFFIIPRYIGYLPWTRGCALGGCYGNFAGYGGCYWRETRVPDGYGGWVVEKICN
jgi:hypothetical protein